MGEQLDFFSRLDNPTLEQLLTPDQIYESDDVALLVSLGEDHRLDYKSAQKQPKEFARQLSAFGNGPSHMGGVIAAGIEKDGKITGCKYLAEAGLQKLESFGSDSCTSGRFESRRVYCKNYKGEDDFIILCRIFYVPDRLVTLSDGTAFQRISHESKKLGDEEKNEIRIAKGERSYEQEVSRLVYPTDFHIDRVRAFCGDLRREQSIRSDASYFLIFVHQPGCGTLQSPAGRCLPPPLAWRHCPWW